MPVKLTPRLATAVPYVRGTRPVLDIGTDHAYLPIYLCESGVLAPRANTLPWAIAADINRGPVERAAIHIAAAGLSESIRTVQTDGLTELKVHAPADIIIFGMGGELIASILAAAPWVRDREMRLILQPMTHAEKLRIYLAETGFRIIGETLSREGERIYQTIAAEWDATPIPRPDPAVCLVGEPCYRQNEEQRAFYVALIDKTLRTETAARDARRRARLDTADSDALLSALNALRASVT